MLRRKLYREYPIFLGYTISHAVRFVALFCIYHLGSRTAYRYSFLGAEALDAGLAYGAIYELYGHLFRTYDGVRKLAGMVFRLAVVVLLAGAVLSAATAPAVDTNRVLAGLFTLDRGVNIVRGGLLLLLFVFSSILSLRWKRFAFGIAAGFAVESSVELTAFALRAHLGSLGSTTLSLISAAAYNCAVVVWLTYLFLPEPDLRPVELPARLELEGWNQALLELLNR
jgi:hypothetical protein